MPHDIHLVAADVFVGNAGVIWIDGKAFCVEVAPKFAVEEQRGLQESIQGLLEFDIDDLVSVAVDGDDFLVDLGCCESHDFDNVGVWLGGSIVRWYGKGAIDDGIIDIGLMQVASTVVDGGGHGHGKGGLCGRC